MKEADAATAETVPGSAAAVRRAEGRLGRYQIVERVGAGGMGEVFAAHDPELDRRVAIKVLHGAGTADGRERLRREAQAMARLAHPNVIVVHDVGLADDRVFVAMELIDGETLRAWRKRETRTWREVVERMVAAGRGLAAAHRAGVIHRDFKPDNVLLGRDGRVVVTDFGLARVGEVDGEPIGQGQGQGQGHDPITVTGTIAGTPAYMAAEQHLGKVVGAAADQFSFCASLYELLWGERPFAAPEGEGVEPAVAVGMEIIAGRVREPPAGGVPGWLRRAVIKGLAVDPDARHASMDALLALLQRGLGRRRRALVVGAVVVGASALVVGAIAMRGG
ncbi:MAG TPA: serine/threonine-protein kinase, partial [Kofleriaceae bacterium]|nr:serine/threonine-protein kinase [Kofleriaceae bacterium]